MLLLKTSPALIVSYLNGNVYIATIAPSENNAEIYSGGADIPVCPAIFRILAPLHCTEVMVAKGESPITW